MARKYGRICNLWVSEEMKKQKSQLIPSVAAVLSCGERILMGKRHFKMKAFPGYLSFPGGKVDRSDENHHAALIRELIEETGIDLSQHPGAIIEEIGPAITPPFESIRFETLFYRVIFPDSFAMEFDSITLDEREFIATYKETPHELLSRYQKGSEIMVPPLQKILIGLDQGKKGFPIQFDKKEGELYRLAPQAGYEMIPVPSLTLPPAKFTNAFLIDGLLVDPAPKDQESYLALVETLKNDTVRAIFITHHHQDHLMQSHKLAKEWSVPMMMSKETHHLIQAQNPHFFSMVKEVKIVREGETVGEWLGRPIKVMEVFGHDLGQLALYPECRSWFLVGDLIQGVGTVVIKRPEGDMGEYFKSLEKVIALNPKYILPSHGTILGGVHFLEKALAHRKQRESDISRLLQESKTEEEILDILYSTIPSTLRPYALHNIRSHRHKLIEEKRIATTDHLRGEIS